VLRVLTVGGVNVRKLLIMSKLPKISTKGGDLGETSLWSGERVPKNHPAIKCGSKIDLMDSYIGLIYSDLNLARVDHIEINDSLQKIQSRLTYLKGEIATHPREWEKYKKKYKAISPVDVDYLDQAGESIKKALESDGYKITGWVQYGSEGKISAKFDYLRALVRDVEIVIYDLEDKITSASINKYIKEYINRLSDYFYWIARYLREK
jgi:cob(I)alamin adenosyltransferase